MNTITSKNGRSSYGGPIGKILNIRNVVGGDCYKTRTTFKTLEETRKFIREVLCPETPRDKSRETVVDEMVCKNGESKW